MSKKKKVLLYVIGVILVVGVLGSIGDEETETKTATTVTTEQEATKTPEITEKETPDLEECCTAIAETLNETYKPNGFVVYGSAYKGKEATFALYMPYTTEEVKSLYEQDKQSLRDLWGNIARTTWDYLSEQGFEVPADTDVNVQVYAADNKKCIVYITKHDTKLQV